MTLQRRIGLGITLGVDPAGGTNFSVLGAVVNTIVFSGAKKTIVDISLLSDLFMPKGASQIDPGKVAFEIAYDKNDAGNTGLLQTTWDGAGSTGVTPATWQLTVPAAGAENTGWVSNFAGWCSGMGVAVDKGKMLVATVEVDISGNPGF